MILLDKKKAEIWALQHYTRAQHELYTRSLDDLANVYEVVDSYNQVISSYLGNNTVQTKQIVFASTQRLLAHVVVIARGCFDPALQSLNQIPSMRLLGIISESS